MGIGSFIGRQGRKIKDGLFGSSDAFRAGRRTASNVAKDAPVAGSREAADLAFKNGDQAFLDNLAKEIEEGKFKFKEPNREKFIGETITKKKKGKNKTTETKIFTGDKSIDDDAWEEALKNTEDISNRQNVWKDAELDRWDKDNKFSKNGSATGKDGKITTEASNLQTERAKFEESLDSGTKSMDGARKDWSNEKYNEYVAKEREKFNQSDRYHVETVDTTNKNYFDKNNENMSNHSQSVDYIVNDKGERRAFQGHNQGIVKDGNGDYTMVKNKIDENIGDLKERGGIFNYKRKANKMGRHFDKNGPSSSTSKMVKMGVGLGITGAGVLAMSRSKGQQSNSQLYGQ